MLVHLGAWSKNPADAVSQLDAIVEVLHKNNVTVARNWIDQYSYRSSIQTGDSQIDWEEAERENEESLARSDAYIAEVSSYRLYHGYELANALSQGKPALLLSNRPFRQYAISGVENKLLHLHEYEGVEDMQAAVESFLHAILLPRDKKEINVPVTQKLYGFLAEQSNRSHKTDGELLRDLAEDGLKYRQIIKC